MILLIHSLLVIISVVCLTAANIRIIPETAKEFEENIYFILKVLPNVVLSHIMYYLCKQILVIWKELHIEYRRIQVMSLRKN